MMGSIDVCCALAGVHFCPREGVLEASYVKMSLDCGLDIFLNMVCMREEFYKTLWSFL